MTRGKAQRARARSRLAGGEPRAWVGEFLETRWLLAVASFPGNAAPPDLNLDDVPAQTVRAGQLLDFNLLSAGGVVTDLDGEGQPTGDTIHLVLDPDIGMDTPEGASITRTGQFRWTPTAAQIGQHTIVVIAVDAGVPALADAETFVIEVLAGNSPPSFTLQQEATANEDAGAVSVPNFATDISAGAGDDGQSVQFEITGNTNAALFAEGGAPAISPTGELTFTPAANAFGEATITVVLKDDGGTQNGGSDTSPPQQFTITINPVNDAPSFTAVDPPAVLEGAGQQSATVASDISPGPGETGQALTFEIVENSNPDLFTSLPVIDASGTITYTADPERAGQAVLTVRLKDDGGVENGGVDASATQQITIVITAVNDAPSFTLSGDPPSIREDQDELQTVADFASNIAPGPAGAVDEANQQLTFQTSVVSTTGNLAFAEGPSIDPTTGDLTYRIVAGTSGAATIQVILQDDGGTENGGDDSSEPQSFQIVVSSNTPPDLAPVADQDATVGEQIEIPVSASDADGDGLTFSLDPSSPASAVIEQTGPTTAVIRWTPTAEETGPATFRVIVTDDGQPPKADQEEFVVTVAGGQLQTDLSIAASGGRTHAAFEQAVTYTIVVANNGAEAANDAQVNVSFGSQLTGIAWTSVTEGGAVAGASGSDTLADTVDLPAGATVTYNVTGFMAPAIAGNQASHAFVTVRASVETPAGLQDSDLSDNTVTDSDLIALSATSGGDGDGQFSAGQAQSEAESLDAALADFDGDGDQDVIVVGQGIRVLINQGGQQAGNAGEFADNGQDLSTAGGAAVAAGDLDNDGDQDAFVVGAAGASAWFNDGPTTPGQFTQSDQTLNDSAGHAVGLADFDGDGDLDAAVLGASGGVLWINQGGTQNGQLGEFVASSQDLTATAGLDGAIGDLDGDGDLDAFLAGASGGGVALNQGGGQGGAIGQFAQSSQDLSAVAGLDVSLGDLDSDGDLDAFVVGDGGAQVWLNDGAGQFTETSQDLAAAVGQRVVLGDLDGDGDLDAAVVDVGGVRVLINQGGDQAGTAAEFSPLGDPFAPAANASPLADLDGDGDLDLFVASGGADQVWLNEPPAPSELSAEAVDAVFGQDSPA